MIMIKIHLLCSLVRWQTIHQIRYFYLQLRSITVGNLLLTRIDIGNLRFENMKIKNVVQELIRLIITK